MLRLLEKALRLKELESKIDVESLRQTRARVRLGVARLYIKVGLLFAITEGILNFLESRPLLGAACAILFVALIGCEWLLRDPGRERAVAIIGTAAVFIVLAAGVVYATSSGFHAYLFWGYVFIPIAFALHGIRIGLVWIGGLVLMAVVLYLVTAASSPVYLSDVIVREFSFSYLVAFALAFMYEYIRQFYERLLARLNERLDELATTDQLTAAYNRRMMERLLGVELQRAHDRAQGFSIILFDLDHFKRVNDTYGHHVGDDVLREVASLARTKVRPADYFGRWGGEEFLVLAGGSDLDAAGAIAERIRAALEEHDFGKVERVTASFGVSAFNADDSILDIIRRADRALYDAKAAGRNRVVVVVPE